MPKATKSSMRMELRPGDLGGKRAAESTVERAKWSFKGTFPNPGAVVELTAYPCLSVCREIPG